MSDCERDKAMVHELLELKTKVDGIIEKGFQSNAQFQGVVREAFESVVNRRQNKPAELIGEVQCIHIGTCICNTHINRPNYHRL